MIGSKPFVVLLVSPSSGVGKSTLGKNLPVYLKGLREDLPVAYLADDCQGTEAMFALPGCAVAPVAGGKSSKLAGLLRLGEYGVEYACLETADKGSRQVDLKRLLLEADFPGILLLDLPSDYPDLENLLTVADLLLVPVKDPAALGAVVKLRKQLLAVGGSSEQMWLLPSELGGSGNYQAAAQSLDFLRFAAEERDFQVLTLTYLNDQQVAQKAAALAKSVLTRLPQSPMHCQFVQLAEFILQQLTSERQQQHKLSRLQREGRLPPRANLVSLTCPFCGLPVLSEYAHYLESIPARRRFLLHTHCLQNALIGIAGKDFLSSFNLAVLLPSSYLGGSAGQVRLLLLDAEPELLEGEDLSSQQYPALEPLFQTAAGRQLSELYQDFLLISAAEPVGMLLSDQWYRSFKQLRGRLQRAWREEKIV